MDVAKGVLPNLRQQILVLSEAARAMSRYDATSKLSPYHIRLFIFCQGIYFSKP
jgi:hypothetical protein